MKKIIGFVVLGVMLFSLVACGSAEKEQTKNGLDKSITYLDLAFYVPSSWEIDEDNNRVMHNDSSENVHYLAQVSTTDLSYEDPLTQVSENDVFSITHVDVSFDITNIDKHFVYHLKGRTGTDATSSWDERYFITRSENDAPDDVPIVISFTYSPSPGYEGDWPTEGSELVQQIISTMHFVDKK